MLRSESRGFCKNVSVPDGFGAVKTSQAMHPYVFNVCLLPVFIGKKFS
jgi:hypothetical protein